MTKNPYTVNANTKLNEAGKLMFTKKINSLLVINKNKRLIGIIQSYDLGI